MQEINKMKEKYKITIPAHHYESDEIVELADFVGDSYKLAVECTKTDSNYIVFCGVKFMAEGAKILAQEHQKVLSPDLTAGCPMADMIDANQLQQIFQKLNDPNLVPIVYMNSYADIKAFSGNHGGAVCTSSNAAKICKYYQDQGKKIFFAPDYNLGRNTANKLGLTDTEIVKINQDLTFTPNKNAKMYIWDGYCHVHKIFAVEQIKTLRKKYPEINIIVHPESAPKVVAMSDFAGSTQQILQAIQESSTGSIWGIGTEIHFVERLAKQNPDKQIFPLLPSSCYNMTKINEAKLTRTLQAIENGHISQYEVKVDSQYIEPAKAALQKMIEIVEEK
ncbi:MAG TPA: quinolinate synthase [Candidatus Cloacimonas sp.]|jgi:quinolinate synthase|nr:quinolinate synthase [Candidatus Cloacimonadota bacterium]HCX73643.1 quinolinate synthase [Candidatus Cloacimonas sp.]